MPRNITRRITSVRKKPVGLIVVLSAPSGAGKTTIANEVLHDVPNVVRMITATSRPKRPGEVHGQDYFFYTKKYFENLIKQNYFIEWANVHDHYYGTPRKLLEKEVASGRIVLLVIDVQGAENIKKLYPDSVLVFILPPSIKELRARLKKRNTETKETLTVRIRSAMIEYGFVHDYDYAVINDVVNTAVNKVKGILKSSLLLIIWEYIPEFLSGIVVVWPATKNPLIDKLRSVGPGDR